MMTCIEIGIGKLCLGKKMNFNPYDLSFKKFHQNFQANEVFVIIAQCSKSLCSALHM